LLRSCEYFTACPEMFFPDPAKNFGSDWFRIHNTPWPVGTWSLLGTGIVGRSTVPELVPYRYGVLICLFGLLYPKCVEALIETHTIAELALEFRAVHTILGHFIYYRITSCNRNAISVLLLLYATVYSCRKEWIEAIESVKKRLEVS
jgi:hypothetical protein